MRALQVASSRMRSMTSTRSQEDVMFPSGLLQFVVNDFNQDSGGCEPAALNDVSQESVDVRLP